MKNDIEKKRHKEDAIIPVVTILATILMTGASILYLIFWLGENVIK